MGIEYRHELTGETDRFLVGKTYVRMDQSSDFEFMTNFSRLKASLWFEGAPIDILTRCGVTCTDPKRAVDLTNLFEGDLNGFYYAAAASPTGSEEGVKWILGGLAAALKERGLGFDKAAAILPADYMRTFCEYLEAKKFDRSFAKDIFAELLAAERFDWDEGACSVRRLTPPEVLDKIVADPRFKAVDTNELDAIIDGVIAANPEQADKARAEPKLIQWFVGQVMKAAKGKAAAPVVMEKLREKLS